MNNMKLFFWMCFPICFLVGNEIKISQSENQKPKSDLPSSIPPFFNREVRSILENTCISCHGVDSQKGDFDLTP